MNSSCQRIEKYEAVKIIRMSQSFSQTCFDLLSLFPSGDVALKLEISESANPSQVIASHHSHENVIVNDNILLITQEDEDNDTVEVTCEIEFDSAVIHVCWDGADNCLAAVDQDGTVHLVKKDGTILLSRAIGSNDVMGICFFSVPESSLQNLGIFYPSGKCVFLKHIDTARLVDCDENDKSALGGILKFMKMEILELGIPHSRNIRIISLMEGSPVGFGVVDGTNKLVTFKVSKEDADVDGKLLSFIDSLPEVVMFSHTSSKLFLVSKLGSLIVYDILSHTSTSCLIASDLVSTLAFKYVNNSEQSNSFAQVQILLQGADGAKYLCTVIYGDSVGTIIVPHGKELPEQRSQVPLALECTSSSWIQMTEGGEWQLSKFSKIFNTISSQLATTIVSAVSGVPSKSSNSFAFSLGQLIVKLNTEVQPAELLQILVKHKFPAETALSAAFVLDYFDARGLPISEFLEKVSSLIMKSDSDVGAEECRKLLRKWKHYHWVISSYAAKYAQQNSGLISMSSLSTDKAAETMRNLLTGGLVLEFLFLVDQLEHLSITELSVNMLPAQVHADNVTKFVTWQRSHVASDDLAFHLEVAEQLFLRSESIVGEGRGREAMHILEYAVSMIDAQEMVEETAETATLREQLQTLLFATRVVVHCKDILGTDYALDEVYEVGSDGIIFERLNSATPDNIRTLAAQAIPTLASHLVLNKDEILLRWLNSTIDNSVLNEDENEDTFATVQKLVSVSECVQEPKLASQAVLKLFQIPNLEKLLKRMSDGGCNIIQKAAAICGELSDASGEKLHEALRSFRLKVIASKYGIEVFDIRDKTHLRILVSIIVNRRLDAVWIEDLSYCAYDRGIIRLELHAVLIRLLTQDTDHNHHHQQQSLDILKALFASLPELLMLTVLDDSIKALITEYDVLCEEVVPEGFLNSKASKSTSSSSQANHQQALDHYISKAKAFIDFYIDRAAYKATSTESDSLSSATRNALSNARGYSASSLETIVSRLKYLQVEFGIYLTSKQIKSTIACKKVLEAFIKHLMLPMTTVVKDTSSTPHQRVAMSLLPVGTHSDELPTSSFVLLQKIATLMNLSPQFAINEILKQYLASGKKVCCCCCSKTYSCRLNLSFSFTHPLCSRNLHSNSFIGTLRSP